MSRRLDPPPRDAVGSRRAAAIAGAALTTATLAVAVPTIDRLSRMSDITVHAENAPQIATSAGAISYSLWYPLLYWTSGASSDLGTLRVTSVVLLTLLVLAKTWIAAGYALRRTGSVLAAVVVGLVALLAMPLPNPAQPERLYLGQVSPTLWHNSTWILSAPFALVTFLAACRLLRSPSRRAVATTALALLVTTACKPNFTLAFAPVLGIALLVQAVRRGERHRAWFWRAVAVLAPTVGLLAAQYVLTFGPDKVVDYTLGVGPLVVWGAFTQSIPWSVAVSLAGPLVLLLAIPRGERTRLEVVVALVTLALATTQLAILVERTPDGTPVLFGNFFWGSFTAMAITMVVLTTAVAQAWTRHREGVRRWRIALATVVVMAQSATGIFYVTHAGVDGFPITYRESETLRVR